MRHTVGDDDLQWLAHIVWPALPDAPDDRIARRRSGTPTVGYRVLPSRRTPWMVAPYLSRRAGLRALATGRALLPRRVLAIRALAAARLLLSSGRGDTTSDGGGEVMALISASLGGRVRPVAVIGEPDPNRKPTLQLVDDDGRTLGYAKVGWNEPTREMVRREGDTLCRLSRRLPAGGRLRVPEVLLTESVPDLGLEILVTRPMPRSLRRWPVRESPDEVIVRTVASVTSRDGALELRLLKDLTMWNELRGRLDRARSLAPEEAARLLDAVDDVLSGVPSDLEVPIGGWHGDLSPWNLAREGGARGAPIWLWDWEHAAAERPLGFDLLHYRFATRRHVYRDSTQAAVDTVRSGAARVLAGVGVDPRATDAIVVSYFVERWLRAAGLAAAGAGWDMAIHPGVVGALGRR